ncbi:MAG: hypothetical protein AAGA30_10090, partial [Planctomycetota bacterium]
MIRTFVVLLSLTSHAAASDVLVGVNTISGDVSVFDTDNGSRTVISNVGANNGITSMASNGIDNQVFVVGSGGLSEIDLLGGTLDTINSNPGLVTGIAYDEQDMRLLGVLRESNDLNNLVEFDLDTGVTTVIGDLGTSVAEITF